VYFTSEANSQYIYFGETGRPQQNNGTFIYTAFGLEHLFEFGPFALRANGIYQSSGSDVLRLPEVAGTGSLYYTFKAFKGELTGRLGVDAFYNTLYKANSYAPHIRQFVLQDELEVGEYIYMDAFFMVQVKNTMLFAKMTNVLEGAVPYNYIGVPGYPLEDRSLRIGINWELWN
jgi:hypothetical protein